MKLSRFYGFLTRSTCRIILEKRLKDIESAFDAKTVLDIGWEKDSSKDYRPRCKKYVTLNKLPSAELDCIADATNMPFYDKTFEITLCTEVLEHVRDYQKLVDEIYRILKDGGVCILSTRFLFKIHNKPGDYFRFTEESLRYIFRRFRDIEIEPMGNKFTVFWDLLFGLSFILVLVSIASPIVRMIFFWDDKDACSGYLVKAKKEKNNMQGIKTGCKVCGSHKRRAIAHMRSDTFEEKKLYHLFRCRICGLRYIKPEPGRDSIKRLYNDQGYLAEVGIDGFNKDGSLKFPPYKSHLYKSILDKLDLYFPHRKIRVLDIGCGLGHFLKIIKDKSWETQGVELSRASAEYVRNKLGINVFCGFLKEALFDSEDFDVVYMGDVLEHMPAPFETLLEARRVLRPGGIIILKTPNAESVLNRLGFIYLKLVSRINPGRNFFLHHLFHFTEGSLKKGIENCGFKHLDTIFLQEPFRTKARGVLRNMIVNGLAALSAFPIQRTSLILFVRKEI